MTDNKKLLKEFTNIYTSCNKAKQGALAEIGKIDEKYRKLAEKEKEQLTTLVKALEEQMKMYGAYLGLENPDEPEQETCGNCAECGECEVMANDDVVEEAIQDTVFPENNEEEKAEPAEETAPEAPAVEEPAAPETTPVEESAAWPEEEHEKVDVKELSVDDGGWPLYPWK